jgi:hypothetical protein
VNERVSEALGHLNRLVSRRKDRCLFRDENGLRCKNGTIGSHSIHRKGALSQVAEDNHVVGLDFMALPSLKPDRYGRIGTRKASVFDGFCGKHDREVFLDIEDGFVNFLDIHALLLCYRALSLERLKKARSLKFNGEVLKSGIVRDATSRSLFEANAEGARLGFNEVKETLTRFEAAIHSNDLTNFHYLACRFDSALPFVSTGAFAPFLDVVGNSVLFGEKMAFKWSHVGSFVGHLGQENYFVIGGFQSHTQHNIAGFIEGLARADSTAIAKMSLAISLSHIENTFFKPSWFFSLSVTDKATIDKLMAPYSDEQYNLPKSTFTSLQEINCTERIWSNGDCSSEP